MQRRNFVKTCVMGGAGTLAGMPFSRVFSAPPKPVGLERIVHQPAHHLRDGGTFSTPPFSEKRDIVIVGAGPAGLSAGYHLRDADILLLEKEPITGGNAQRDEWNGIYFTQGTAFMDLESEFTKFLKAEFDLQPGPVGGNDALVVDNKVYHDIFFDGWKALPYPEDVRQDFHRLFEECRANAQRLYEPMVGLFMNQAPADSPGHREAMDLQNMTFAAWLNQRNFKPEVQAFCDLYCPPQVSSYPDQMTALVGTVWMGYAGSYDGEGSFPGGLAPAAEAMAKAVADSGPDRIRTGSFVTAVVNDPQGQHVDVTYARGDEMRTVRARQCLWAGQQHIASRVIHDMPAEQVEAISHVKYNDLSVINLCYRKQIYNGAYQTWIDGAPIVNMLPADWVLTHGKTAPDQPQVLTCDWPNRVRDRALLLDDAWVVEQCQRSAQKNG